MHRRVILLVKSDHIDVAVGESWSFLNDYLGSFYDNFKVEFIDEEFGALGEHGVLRLSECIDVVKEYSENTDTIDDILERAKKFIDKDRITKVTNEFAFETTMRWSYAARNEDFYPECYVFNIYENNYHIPNDPDEINKYLAVLADIHR